MRRKSSLISLSIIAATCSLQAFVLDSTRPSGPRPAELEERQWLIQSYFIGEEEIWLSGLRKVGQTDDAYISFKSGVIEGSPGCGKFTGTYHKAGTQLAILTEWTDETETCGSDLTKGAEQILRTLNNVRGIQAAPSEWHSDDLLLIDAKGSTQAMLGPMEPGKDLSELQNTFWHLAKLEGSHDDLSGVIIEIENGDITFSTVSYSTGVVFEYKRSGLQFPTATPVFQSSNNRQSWRDQEIAKVFSTVFRQTMAYRLSQGNLSFLGKDQKNLILLSPLQQEGIENRRWHIARYRGDGSQHADKEGQVEATEPAEITFLHGRADGSTGCGAWFGAYRVSGDHVTVLAGSILAGACSPAGYTQGPLVEDAFKGQLQIEKNREDILLRDMTGKARIPSCPIEPTGGALLLDVTP